MKAVVGEEQDFVDDDREPGQIFKDCSDVVPRFGVS